MDKFATKITELHNGYLLQYRYTMSRRHVEVNNTVYFAERSTATYYLIKINLMFAKLEPMLAHTEITKLINNYK